VVSGYRYGVPLVAAVVCPHPPLLVPEVAAGAAAELDEVRAACDTALAGFAAAGVQHVAVVGGDARTTAYDYPFAGTFAPWGVPLEVHVGPAGPPEPLPLSLLVGFWLVKRYLRVDGAVSFSAYGIAADSPPAACAALGQDLNPSPARWALLAMGDGSACRSPSAPGYADPRAEPFDGAVAGALDAADPAALLALDPVEAAELRVAGRAPWQVLAGAIQAAGGDWTGTLHYTGAPYGVGYFVASWAHA